VSGKYSTCTHLVAERDLEIEVMKEIAAAHQTTSCSDFATLLRSL